MKLPININDLLMARTVESERIEYKEGWNPEAVLHTMCAFANDFFNQGGGYLIIGIRAIDGVPQLPPAGIEDKEIDPIMLDLTDLSYKILPQYNPISDVVEVQGKKILVLWCPGGTNRPYKAPVNLAKGNKQRAYYIRRNTSTIQLKENSPEELELIQMAASIPFDDRINQRASMDDLYLGLIREYLQSVNSDLFASAASMDFQELLLRMNLIDGSPEKWYPKNVGLMFFNPEPETYFPQTQIDVLNFPEGEGAATFTEKSFKGPINKMLQDALDHLKISVISEKVIKFEDQAESQRVYNYPYSALEEALCNAVYHRSYEEREPIEVKILPDSIRISSFPGPDRSITDADLAGLRFISRRYRNRRIGEFLKELRLTEGRGTGYPNIVRAMTENGSELPKIYTDETRSYFVIEFQIQKEYLDHPHDDSGKGIQDISHISDQVRRLIIALSNGNHSVKELMSILGLKERKSLNKLYLSPARRMGYVEMLYPDKPKSDKQKYKLTESGMKILRLVH